MPKSSRLSDSAAKLYESGLSVDDVASELKISYRCARKAILLRGVRLRDPSARLKGRTSPKKKKVK